MNSRIALTFDDGPSIYTERILDTLERCGARATFYVCGKRIDENKDTLKRAYDAGHEIGCHTWTHPRLPSLSRDEIHRELTDTNEAIRTVIGVIPKTFRPPYGAVSDDVTAVAAELGLPVINWSVDPFDWNNNNPDIIFRDIMSKLHEHAIILCHDLYDSTADAMELLVPELIRKGYELVTISELLESSGITPEPGVVYDNG